MTDIEAAWESAGAPGGYGGALARIGGRLEQDEAVHLLAPGRVDDANGIVVLTDRRVLFVTRQAATTITDGFRWGAIVSADADGDRLAVIGTASALVVQKLPDNDATLLADAIDARLPRAYVPIDAPPAPAPAPPVPQMTTWGQPQAGFSPYAPQQAPPGYQPQFGVPAPVPIEGRPWFPPVNQRKAFPERHPVALGVIVAICLVLSVIGYIVDVEMLSR